MKLKLFSSIVDRFGGHKEVTGKKACKNKPIHGAAAIDECEPTESLDGSFNLFNCDEQEEDSLTKTRVVSDDGEDGGCCCFGCDAILNKTAYLRDTLATHELYNTITSIERLRTFMECHVFAVLNF